MTSDEQPRRGMQAQQNDTSTLDGARYVLTVKNENKFRTSGDLESGTSVICLRRSESGYYVPCVATVVSVTPGGRVAVDLYEDKSERVTVSQKAILWS